jgi:hypothetical protein
MAAISSNGFNSLLPALVRQVQTATTGLIAISMAGCVEREHPTFANRPHPPAPSPKTGMHPVETLFPILLWAD